MMEKSANCATASATQSRKICKTVETDIFPSFCNIEKQLEICESCEEKIKECISKAHDLLCREEARLYQGLAVNSESGELIALYEGLSRITREICSRSQNLISQVTSTSPQYPRELCALMQSRNYVVRELMTRGKCLNEQSRCKATLPPRSLLSGPPELPNLTLLEEVRELGLHPAIARALRFVNIQ